MGLLVKFQIQYYGLFDTNISAHMFKYSPHQSMKPPFGFKTTLAEIRFIVSGEFHRHSLLLLALEGEATRFQLHSSGV